MGCQAQLNWCSFELSFLAAVATSFSVHVQGPPGPSGLQGPIGAPGPAVSTRVILTCDQNGLAGELCLLAKQLQGSNPY